MPVKKLLTVVLIIVLCLLPIKDSIATPIVEYNSNQDLPPVNETSTGIAPTSDLNDSGTSSLSGSNVTFDSTAGGASCYVPDTLQTFCFQSETYTTDWEYVNNNWIKFPTDWTVSNVYVQGTPVCDSGGGWGAFTWSFQTSPYEVNVAQGRNQMPTDHCVATYCVDVIPSGLADPAEVSWYFDGDGYGALPHNPCSNDGYTPSGQAACDEMVNPLAAVPPCGLEVIVTPPEIQTSGCHGEAQFHILTLTNQTGAQATFDVTYNKNFPGDFYGVEQITLADGATTSFDVYLDPHLCTADADYTATVTVSDGTYSDQTIIHYEIFSGLNEWRSIQTSPIGRMDNVLAAFDGKVWNIAGYGGSAEVNYYDPNIGSWTNVPASAPPWGAASYPRSGCQMGDKVYLYGDAATVGFTGLWSYNMATNTWAQETPSGTPPPYTGIWSPSWVADPESGLCYMTGGATTPGTGNLSTVYVYNTNTNSWWPPRPEFSTVRDFHAAFLYNRPSDGHKLLCVAGGNNGAELSSTQCHDLLEGSWNSENADLGVLPGSLFGMGFTKRVTPEGEQLWMLGGSFNTIITNQTWYYDVSSGTWMDGGFFPSSPVYRTAAVTLNNDVYHMGGATSGFSYTGLSDKRIDLICPECHVPDMTKEATELALPGQTIHYNITLDPMVIDSALVYDFLPDQVAYVPGSLTVTPEIGEYGYDTISESVWWYSGSVPAKTNAWTPAEKLGTSLTTDITAQSDASTTVVQVESTDYAINSVLWDQPLSSISQTAYVDQDFLDFPEESTYLADDFEVSVPWLIETIFVPGHGWNGFSSLLNANVLTFMIYKDNAGIPAGDPSGVGALPVWVYQMLPTDPQITITAGSGGLPSNTQLDLSFPILLPPGHYWFIFYPSMSLSTGGQFGRQPADTMNAHSARVINPGGGFGYGPDWQPWMVWWGFDSDMAFRMEGMEVPNLQIEFDATVTAPLNHVIWNSAFLEYGSYISQANDDTFTGYGVFLPMTIK